MSKISYYIVIGKETRRLNFISGFEWIINEGKKGWFRIADKKEVTFDNYTNRNQGTMECFAIGKTARNCKPVMEMERY